MEEGLKKKAVIAMSGGVDSSVAAYLMKKKGFECVGMTFRTLGNTAAVPFRMYSTQKKFQTSWVSRII